jgi:uncharacterized protein (TIGR02147 family)
MAAATSFPITFDVFSYLDYRRLLRDYYVARKAAQRGFSYRVFARGVGVRSPSHLKRVIDGERNLSSDSAGRCARAIGLRGESADYFGALVRFNQSQSRDDRERAYDHMRSFLGYRKAHFIDARYADYHAHWWVPAVREMVLRQDFRDDSHWIARQLLPPIRPAEAEAALETLFDLGMLVRCVDGRIRQAEAVVSTGPETSGIHIARYHETMMTRAAESISLVPGEERFISSLTFCVGPSGFATVRERVQRFRQELISLLAEEPEGDQVLQLGIRRLGSDRRRQTRDHRASAPHRSGMQRHRYGQSTV